MYLIKSILKWLVLSVTSVFMTATAYIFAIFLYVFADDKGNLPWWLKYYQTQDNPIWGDQSFHDKQMAWTKSPYLRSVFWLWRNPAYGFDYYVLGIVINSSYAYSDYGDPSTSNTPMHSGWYVRVLDNHFTTYWQLYIVIALTKTACIRINLGWKLWGLLIPGQRRPLVISFNGPSIIVITLLSSTVWYILNYYSHI